jgi:CheY-like chemotaxis protein
MVPIEIRDQLTGRNVKGQTTWAGESHCYIITPKPFEVGTNVNVTLRCDRHIFAFHGRVVYTKSGCMNVATTKMKIDVLIVDGSKPVRDRLVRLLQLDPEIRLIGEAADELTAIDLADHLHPNAIVMELTLPPMNAQEVAKGIREKWPEIPIILTSRLPGHEEAAELSGTRVFLPNDSLDRELCPTIHRLARAAIRLAISRASARNEYLHFAAKAGG